MECRDDALKLADIMNRTAAKLRPHGIRLGYHNHAHEFVVSKGEILMETLLRNTEPDIFAEFDVFWIAYAGYDPVRFIKKYAGRQPLMHLKELGPDRKANVECGAGVLDFANLITLGKEAGVKHFIVEQEEYTMPPLESCAVSVKNLLAL
jgi:sugar phosphate isomerase/epimerase